MSIYIALLRGINVGGHNKIKMADLRAALENEGLLRVQTYIQSGNILFESSDEEAEVRLKLEKLIAREFGIALTVILRTAEELERIVAQRPFPPELIAAAEADAELGKRLNVALLPEEPHPDGVAKLAAADSGGDEYRLVGRDLYLLFLGSIRDSKLAVQVGKIGVPATVRNWNTMLKLAELAREMKEQA